MIEVDGSYLEGGGQIIRSSLSLASITKKPFRIFNIRANRPNPGLAAQHLTACKSVRNICRGTLKGAELGSTELSFEPGEIIGGRYDFNIGTAGSVTLVAQTVIPILLYAQKPSTVRIVGGTHVMKSPSYDYFERVFLQALKLFSIDINSKMNKAGYYPKGGGEIEFNLTPFRVTTPSHFPESERTKVIISLSNLPMLIAIREKKVFVQNDIEDIYVREENALDAGNSITAFSGLKGSYALGKKGKRAEEVATEALTELKKETGDLDRHLADQLLLYFSLAEGSSRFRVAEVTDHLKTNAYVISKFLDKRIEIGENEVLIS